MEKFILKKAKNIFLKMLFQKHIYFVLVFLSVLNMYSQQSIHSEIDSLSNKSFTELMEIFYYYKNIGQIEEAKETAFYTLTKAKRENNSKAITNSYMRLCRIFHKSPELALRYIDSSIFVAEKRGFKELLAEGYFFKARTYFALQDFEKSLIYYVKAKEYFDRTEDKNMYYAILNNIGLIKQRVNSNEEALKIFKECYQYDKSLGVRKMRIVDHLNTIASLSIAYGAVNQRDSATLMNIEGYKLAKKIKTFNPLVFTRHEGANQYFLGNYHTAKDSLLKAVPYLINSRSIVNLCYTYYQLGKIYNYLSNKEKEIFYYKKIDSIFLDSNYILPEPRDIYESLINYYRDNDSIRKQLYFTERLLYIDSVLLRDYDKLISTLHKQYDTPELRRQKNLLEASINKKDKGITFLAIIIIIVIFIFILVAKYIENKRKLNEKRFRKIIEDLKKKAEESSIKIDIERKPQKRKPLNISQNIIDSILKELDIFECNEGYLEPKLNLTTLAKKIETNSKYLSKVLNTYKSKTYYNYINDLRIDYVIKKIEKDNIFRKYTIKAIAMEAGYNNTESFTMAFHKRTGISVSYFIRRVNSMK